jgi:two-component system chemotaxis sensor kinase CheA
MLDLPERDENRSHLQVIVYADRGHRVGLVVDCIVDIVEESLQLERPIEHRSLLGSSVIQERVTDVLDVQSIVRRAHPGWFAEPADAA